MIAIARPAATIVLARDGVQGMEVFMVVRHHQIDFASGALVFPGGRVEDGDGELARDRSITAAVDGVDDDAMAFRIAAIRETFEECGVLFAHSDGSDALIDGAALRQVEHAHRAALADGKIAFRAVLRAHGLRPSVDRLVDFAHWITPENQPKRYDTRFFFAVAPAEHLAVHDGSESVDSLWVRPARALEEAKSGRFKLVFATELNLAILGGHATTAEAIAEARARPVVTVLPKLERLEGGRRVLRIPVEAGYGGPEFVVDNPPAS